MFMKLLPLRACALAIVFAATALPARAASEPAIDLLDAPVSYTAQFSVSSDKGTYDGTVWHAPGRERRDFQTNNGSQTILLRRDTDAAYLMKPSGRWYVGLSFQAVGALAGGVDALTVNRRKVGDATVAGIRATRYKVDATGPKNSSFEGDAWFSQDGILLRAEGVVTAPDGKRSNVSTTLSNVKVGPVADLMFELPSGWFGMDLRTVPPDRIAQAVEGIKPLLEGRGGAAHQ